LYLKPKKKDNRFNPSFWVFDCETESLKGVNFIIGAIFRIHRDIKERILLFQNPSQVLDFLVNHARSLSQNTIRKKGKFRNIFIHNLTFDIRFLMKEALEREEFAINYIASSSKDLVVELNVFLYKDEKERDVYYKFRFIDSFQFTLCSQEILEQNILGEVKKRIDIKVGVDKSLTYRDYIVRVKSDVEGLYLALKGYFTMIYEIFGVNVNSAKTISLSRLSLKAFLINFLNKKIFNPFLKYDLEKKRYVIKNETVLFKVYSSYFGGRTELFRRGIFSNVISFDINSLYPSVFENTYPINGFYEREIKSLGELEYYLYHHEGFLEGEIFEHYSKIPIIPVKGKEGKTLFAYGLKRGVFTFPEIRYALSLDLLKINFPCNCIIFQKGDFFNKFGKWCFNERRKFQSLKSPFEYPLKIMMNSLYGKFGQKLKQRGILILDRKQRKEFYLGKLPEEFLTKGEELIEIREYGDNTVFYYVKTSIKPYSLPHIASYVCAYARLRLHQAMRDNYLNLLYCDTDSIWLNGEPKNLVISDSLGDWKKEYITTKACFVALKFYAYETIEGELKMRIKGVSNEMFRKANFKDVHDFYNRSIGYLFEESERYNKIRSSLRTKGTVLSCSIRTKKLTGKYDKRNLTKIGDTYPIMLNLSDWKT